MSFTGNEEQSISLGDAAKLTENYRESVATGSILGGYFSKGAIEKIIDQSQCVGFRYYYAKMEDGTPAMVLVGVKSNQDDLYNGEIMEHSVGCPPFCSSPNPLNS